TATTEIYTLSLHDALPISVIALDLDHCPPGARRGQAELVALALDHQRRHRHRLELRQAARRGLGRLAPRWREREGQAEHGRGADGRGGAAGPPRRPRTPPA